MKMMDGVEVLNTIPVYAYDKWWIGLIIGIVLTVAICLIMFFKDCAMEDIWCAVLLGILFTSFACLFSAVLGSKQIGEKYQVTIHDSVSMNEFTEKYRIIKQEGKIYTIEEKK